MAYFTEWDGTLLAGNFSRASSSDIKIWGEINKTTDDLVYGTAVAFNPAGGVKKFTAVTEVFAGVVVRDIYPNAAPNGKITEIAKIGIGDGIRVATVAGQTFTRGAKVYIQCTGANAGLFTATASASTIDVGYIVDKVGGGTNGVIEVTLNNTQVAGA
jgi:hypothetical protein